MAPLFQLKKWGAIPVEKPEPPVEIKTPDL